jgi:hypothetical protein
MCAVGRSTKSGSYGYIGAKGIGFKSVFIAAWKVYIESGHFSFYFKHQRGDPGLEMVTPIWQNRSGDEIPGPLTRMTLHLHEHGDPAELENLCATTHKQFDELRPKFLLFLRQLNRIRITMYDEDGEGYGTTTNSASVVWAITVFWKLL